MLLSLKMLNQLSTHLILNYMHKYMVKESKSYGVKVFVLLVAVEFFFFF